jgi:hypothetical protein
MCFFIFLLEDTESYFPRALMENNDYFKPRTLPSSITSAPSPLYDIPDVELSPKSFRSAIPKRSVDTTAPKVIPVYRNYQLSFSSFLIPQRQIN